MMQALKTDEVIGWTLLGGGWIIFTLKYIKNIKPRIEISSFQLKQLASKRLIQF